MRKPARAEPLSRAETIQLKHDREESVHQSKEIRQNMSEKEIDKMLKDTFPASDPPSSY